MTRFQGYEKSINVIADLTPEVHGRFRQDVLQLRCAFVALDAADQPNLHQNAIIFTEGGNFMDAYRFLEHNGSPEAFKIAQEFRRTWYNTMTDLGSAFDRAQEMSPQHARFEHMMSVWGEDW